MGKKCGICTINDSKYKCPGCFAPYCSVTCFKTHKETPCAPSTTSTAEGTESSKKEKKENDGMPDFEAEELTKLNAKQLQALDGSDELTTKLKNKDLLKILKAIDGSEDPEALLEKAMRESGDFQDFANTALSTIEYN
ncbi:hypothetical protein HDU97_005972 [Phlyctochytrium planicorne]|nr:hypothetical protein HDU97_005972 [Phlyctochytrium planicorne]